MRVLIVGGANRVTNALIEKLSKEKAKIYVLTGGKKKGNKYHNVYEKYNFEYDNPCVKEIMESVNPDITVFTGAFDSNFNWGRGYDEVQRYINSLTNVCSAFSLRKHGRLVYLSSEEASAVSLDEYREIATRDRMLTDNVADEYSRAYKSIAIRTGERLVKNMAANDKTDMLAIRVEELCYKPDGLDEVQDMCSRMCVEALNSNTITITKDKAMPLYINDFVEFMYRAVIRTGLKHKLYRMSSDSVIDSGRMAEIIDRELKLNTKKNINAEAASPADEDLECIPSISAEMGMKVYKEAEKCVTDIAAHIAADASEYIEKTKVKSESHLKERLKNIFRILLPFIENIIIFIPFFMINNRVTGSIYFAKLDCYLLYVLLFAIIYGQQQASFSAILAVCGYVFREMYSRSGFDIVLDYNTYVDCTAYDIGTQCRISERYY